MRTIEQLREYRREYYKQHKQKCYHQYLDWRDANPEKAAATQQRWRASHPHYYRDYMRNRKLVVEPLIFQFLDNGHSENNDVDGFTSHLRAEGVSEKHIRWLKVDLKKYLEKE